MNEMMNRQKVLTHFCKLNLNKVPFFLSFSYKVPCAGQALVPYYRKILPILNLFRNKNICLLDQIEFNRMGELGDVIDRTLQILECNGGPNAYINMKHMVPTYESCVMN